MSYSILLFDLDHTLLDFAKAEDVALRQLLEEARVKYIQSYVDYYVPMNMGLWEDLAQGRITKKELLDTRFERLFAHFGQVVDGRYFAGRYQHFLSQQGQSLAGAKELVVELKQRGYRLFAATNGVTQIQESRLANSDLADAFEQVFISEQYGTQKPDKLFFDKIAEEISDFDTASALMIGDSLSADIQGGNNAGIDTVWYNPRGLDNTSKARPTYVVESYSALLDLLPAR